MENSEKMNELAAKLTRPANKSEGNVVPNLEKLTKPQLMELRDRQGLLLKNKNRLQKLPDRGRKIQEMYDRIEERLREVNQVDEAAKMFSELNIASRGQSALTNLEWTGKCHPQSDFVVDSDDEEAPNPLKVLAQSRNTEKKVKVVKEVPLITEEDFREIQSFSGEAQQAHLVETELKSEEKLRKLREKYTKPPQSDESRSTSSLSGNSAADLEPHALLLCAKETITQVKEKFRPYQTTKSHVHSPQKEIERGGRKKWDVTAATPPQLTHPGVKMLSLQESIELQMRKEEEVKALEKKYAEQKLLEKSLKMVSSNVHAKDLSQFFKTYREVPESDLSDLSESSESLELDSEDEVKDLDAEEPRGGVVVVNFSH
ncbi:uncharacterized protein LOC129796157 [Lutzomyia longipalpis]|uniref:uncharacterized protein LOC129796157 n=1 Tax=Lutzomyia longipalpis TaxID=7200 RepID=UPI00248407F3|nr:uncharacterized protein LOC129796157 [Lutzomyia longipalpis]